MIVVIMRKVSVVISALPSYFGNRIICQISTVIAPKLLFIDTINFTFAIGLINALSCASTL